MNTMNKYRMFAVLGDLQKMQGPENVFIEFEEREPILDTALSLGLVDFQEDTLAYRVSDQGIKERVAFFNSL